MLRLLGVLFLLFAANCAAQSTDAEDTPEDVPIMEIPIGNEEASEDLEIYVSPSCLHCGRFLSEDVEEFLKKNTEAGTVLKFLPTSAKDIFIMKLIQNEAPERRQYFAIFKNYIKRALATIDRVEPTKEQVENYRGSKTDPEMIKFQVVASEFGFSDKKIIAAFPNMKGKFEKQVIAEYKKKTKKVSKLLKSKELDLPLIVRHGKVVKKLEE